MVLGAAVFSLAIAAPAFSARLPKAKTAQAVLTSHLKSYGNRFKTTPFYHNVGEVSINAIEEISYKTVYTDAVVNLKDGGAMRVLAKMDSRFPRGWKVLSWEILETR